MAVTLNANTSTGFVATSDLTGAMTLQTAGMSAVHIDNSQNVGVGITNPTAKFHVYGGSNNQFKVQSSGDEANISLSGTTYGQINNNVGDLYITTDAANSKMLFRTAGTEQMRITKDGDFLMAPAYRTEPRGKVDISAVGGTVSGLPSVCLAMSRWGDAGIMVNFFPNHGSTTSIGNIYNAGLTNTQYNTSSDYRLKENIAPMTGALTKIALLKPCTYTWKSTQADGQGFIAHELQEVFPDAVCGEKDAVDGEGNVVSQGVDTSYLVATLTAAIQELKAIVDAQATEIAELKTKVGP